MTNRMAASNLLMEATAARKPPAPIKRRPNKKRSKLSLGKKKRTSNIKENKEKQIHI